MIARVLRAVVRPEAEADARFRDVLWPASFPASPRARIPAHALAALVVLTAVCLAFQGFYWADDPEVGRYRAADLRSGRN
ncbi:hypothetical protein [Streptomyces sp. NPDC020362]|uniref:hypothetical protein n=1 Tax=Streptomyces sp. NPDC020362 TaxID=3154486 RepID=UPI0033DBD697